MDDPWTPQSPAQGEDNLLYKARMMFPLLQGTPMGYTENFQQNPPGYLEYWSPQETGDVANPRPRNLPPGAPGLEVYNKDTKPQDIAADVVSHQLVKTDPKFTAYYNSFVGSMTPDQHSILQSQYDYAKKNGETRDFASWRDNVGLPAYFRGYAFKQWPEDFNARAYTPEQRKMFDDMLSQMRK